MTGLSLAFPSYGADKVVLQLRWEPQFQFAGYYAALWHGFYAEAGLDVEIRTAVTPDRHILNATKEVAEGRAEFGIGAADVLVARDAGSPLVFVAAVMQQSPVAVFARSELNVRSPADLTRLRVGRVLGDLTDAELVAMLDAEGIDSQQVAPALSPNWQGRSIDLLQNGELDAYTGYTLTALWRARQLGMTLSILRPATYGIDFYGDSLFTHAGLVDTDPDLVERFVTASIRGWEYALQHADEIALRIATELPRTFTVEDAVAFNRFQATEVERLMMYPVVPVGQINPRRLARMHRDLKHAGLVHGDFVQADAVFDPVQARRKQREHWVKALIGASSLLVLFIAGILAWSWTLRRQVATRTKELADSEERFRHAFEQAAVGIAHVGTDGGWLRVNQRLLDILGYSRDELLRMTFQDITHPDDLGQDTTYLRRLLAGEVDTYLREKRYVRKDGTTVWAHLTVALVRHETGEPHYFVSVIEDISDRKGTEDRLHLMQRTLDHAGDAVLLVCQSGRIKYANESCARLLEYGESEVLEKRIWDVDKGAGQDEWLRLLKSAASSFHARTFETIYRTRTGHEVPVEVTMAQLDHGERGIVCCFARDITKRKQVERDLIGSEERFRSVFRYSPAGLVLKDAEGRTQLVNKMYEQMFQTTADTVIGKTSSELYDAETARQLDALDEQVRRTGQPIEQDLPMRLPAFGDRLLHFVKFPVFDSAGTVSGIGGFGIDITDRKLIESAMQTLSSDLIALEGPNYWRAAVLSLSRLLKTDIAFVCRPELQNTGRIQMLALFEDGSLHTNRSFDIAGTPWAEICHADDGKLVCIERGMGERYPDDSYVRDNGVDSFAAVPLIDHAGQTLGYLGVMNRSPLYTRSPEETVLKMFAVAVAAAMSREHNRRQYSDLFEFAPEAILLVDGSGRMTLANRQAETIFGWSRAEMVGEPIEMLVPFDKRKDHIHMRAVFSRSPNRRRLATDRRDLYGQRKDGSTFPVEIDLAPVETDDGVMIAAAVRDVTARKELEAQLTQAQKMEAVGQLTGGIAHDFNNLLAIIRGNAELLADFQTAETEHLIQPIIRSSHRGAELTQRLLAFSRQQELHPRTVHTGELVQGMSDLLERSLGETIDLDISIDGDLWNIWADAGQLENALLNLSINARDAMPAGGTLRISCENVRFDKTALPGESTAVSGSFVALAVHDTGIGMPADVRDQAFSPFFTTKEVGHGSGLGLSMVYGFVKQSNGYAVIESAEGAGTTVTLYMPRAQDRNMSEADKETGNIPCGKGETILVIEDNNDVRILAINMLTGLGYNVVDVADAAEARDFLKQNPKIDLILSDVILPGGTSGPEFAEEVRARDPASEVIFMSGYTADAVEPHFAAWPDAVVLSKPFQKQSLAKAVRDALDS